jgi:hypothetical protein
VWEGGINDFGRPGDSNTNLQFVSEKVSIGGQLLSLPQDVCP